MPNSLTAMSILALRLISPFWSSDISISCIKRRCDARVGGPTWLKMSRSKFSPRSLVRHQNWFRTPLSWGGSSLLHAMPLAIFYALNDGDRIVKCRLS